MFHIPLYWLFSYPSLYSSFSDDAKYYSIHIDLLESSKYIRLHTMWGPLTFPVHCTITFMDFIPEVSYPIGQYTYHFIIQITLMFTLSVSPHFLLCVCFHLSSFSSLWRTPLSISFSIVLMVTNSSKCCLSKNILFIFILGFKFLCWDFFYFSIFKMSVHCLFSIFCFCWESHILVLSFLFWRLDFAAFITVFKIFFLSIWFLSNFTVIWPVIYSTLGSQHFLNLWGS